MKPTFQNTVKVWVKAYLDDTLTHASCYACAIGNLVAAANDWKVIKHENRQDSFGFPPYITHKWIDHNMKFHNPYWTEVFSTCCITHKQGIFLGELKGLAKEEIDSTGYRWDELAMIEFAFETTVKGINDTNDDWMFNGLMNCVEVAAAIHGIDIEEMEEAKKLFVKV